MAHDFVGKGFHVTAAVLNNKPFLGPEKFEEMTRERIALSLARPPALRIICASPSARLANS